MKERCIKESGKMERMRAVSDKKEKRRREKTGKWEEVVKDNIRM